MSTFTIGTGFLQHSTVQSILQRLSPGDTIKFTPGVHDIIIVNDDLESAYKKFEDFVYKPLE